MLSAHFIVRMESLYWDLQWVTRKNVGSDAEINTEIQDFNPFALKWL